MTIASEYLSQVAEEKGGYFIGEPWRFSKLSLAAIVPILRANGHTRAYRLMAEVGEGISIRDTGRIDRLDILNKGDVPVLVKSGELVVGATQTRGLVLSQVIMPGEEVQADCVCVYATMGIRTGQKVRPGGYSPSRVREQVLSGYSGPMGPTGATGEAAYHYSDRIQQEVWGAVRSQSRGMAEAGERYASMNIMSLGTGAQGALPTDGALRSPPDSSWRVPAEDLAGRVAESKTKFEDVMKAMPKIDNQIGICFIAIGGFELLEAFDHPASWYALREQILGAEAAMVADVRREDSVFEYKPAAARKVIQDILSSPLTEHVAVNKHSTATFMVEIDRLGGVIGEVVTLFDEPIHCNFIRKSN